jgi:hypothetical protein
MQKTRPDPYSFGSPIGGLIASYFQLRFLEFEFFLLFLLDSNIITKKIRNINGSG